MTTNSPNPVDGDVQALIEHIKEVLQEYEEHGGIGYGEVVYRTALAALTAEPVGEVVDVGSSRMVEWDLCISDGARLYTAPPAQILRQVELPEPYDDGHGNLWLPRDAVISAVKKAGGEVKL